MWLEDIKKLKERAHQEWKNKEEWWKYQPMPITPTILNRQFQNQKPRNALKKPTIGQHGNPTLTCSHLMQMLHPILGQPRTQMDINIKQSQATGTHQDLITHISTEINNLGPHIIGLQMDNSNPGMHTVRMATNVTLNIRQHDYTNTMARIST